MEGHQQIEAAGQQAGLNEWHRLHGDAKKHVSAWQGKDLEKQKGRLPPGEEVTRRVYVLYHSQTAFFLLKQREIQSRTKFLNGVIGGLCNLLGSEEVERSHRSEATTLSEAARAKRQS